VKKREKTVFGHENRLPYLLGCRVTRGSKNFHVFFEKSSSKMMKSGKKE
jgi:hypothetical protein